MSFYVTYNDKEPDLVASDVVGISVMGNAMQKLDGGIARVSPAGFDEEELEELWSVVEIKVRLVDYFKTFSTPHIPQRMISYLFRTMLQRWTPASAPKSTSPTISRHGSS